MTDILLIEDDINKIKQLNFFLDESETLLGSIHLTTKHSYQSGLEAILEQHYNMILLDMSMHNFDKSGTESGGEFMQFAGENILQEMNWTEILTPVIIVTQYDLIGNKNLNTLRKEWEMKFKPNYRGCVYYSANELSWKKELLEIMKNIINDNSSNS